ncbi:MAG: beta-ketoacyl-ACP synthase III [Candidatus Sumerlaeota bacterium]
MPFGILGVGSALPDRVLTNEDLEKMVETSDEWIRTRSGISERRIAGEGEATSDFATQAARNALEMAGMEPGDVDMIIVATFSGDTHLPATACHVQAKLGIERCGAFDVNAACTGFIYGLATARGMFTTGVIKNALVIGADCTTKFVDFEDRSTCVLFGDGAGAVVVGEVPEGRGVLSEFLSADGSMADRIIIPGGGSLEPVSEKVLEEHNQYIKMAGNDVFKFAVRIMSESIKKAASRAGVKPADLDWIIPHQANIRIIDGALKRLKTPKERCILNIDRYGNTSAASVPIALDEAVRDGRVKEGDLLGFVAFGGGLTWGANVLRF